MALSAKDLYSRMETGRQTYLGRARRSATLTIPTLLPPSGHQGGEDIPDPFQSIGAQAVNSLASKLLQTLFNSPFFRLRPRPDIQQQLDEDQELELQVSQGLAQLEQLFMSDVDGKNDRVTFFETLKHLIVAGNGLIYDDPDAGLKLFHLDKYVVRRDAFGTPVVMVVREVFDRSTAPSAVLEITPETTPVTSPRPTGGGPALQESNLPTSQDDQIEVYTVIELRQGEGTAGPRYHIWQENGSGLYVPGSESDTPLDRINWYPLRMVRVDGEDYGRGIIEEYYGDLNSLEGLTKAIVQGSAAASKVYFLVRPNGNTSMETLANSPNGTIASGDAEDVTVVQLGKFNDFRVAQEVIREIETRLMAAFLMNQAVRRNAERVTAEEIRFIAEELERGLGGIYSLLTQEFQLPYVRHRLTILQQQGVLPRLPQGAINPVIITGLEALDRGREAERLVRFFGQASQIVGPQELIAVTNVRAFLERLALAEGVDTSELFKTEEQIAQEAQQAQIREQVSQVAPNVIDAGADLLQSGALQGGAPPAPPQA